MILLLAALVIYEVSRCGRPLDIPRPRLPIPHDVPQPPIFGLNAKFVYCPVKMVNINPEVSRTNRERRTVEL